MENILNFIRTDTFLIIISIVSVLLLLLLLLTVINNMKIRKLNKRYKEFMLKLGKGNNLEEMLRSYIERVEIVSTKNEEMLKYCKRLDQDLATTIRKVGIYRYNAFKDTGSDLSFTLALLNDYNDGVVLNGIYSREMSNIYAKPIKNGTSTYTISPEEKEAINRAIQSDIIEIRE